MKKNLIFVLFLLVLVAPFLFAPLQVLGVGNTQDLTVGRGTWVSGGYAFNGTNSNATKTGWEPFKDEVTDIPFTLAFWIRFEDDLNQYDYIMGQFVSVDDRIVVRVANYSCISFRVNDGGKTCEVTGNITVGPLYFIAIMFNGSETSDAFAIMYVNDTKYVSSSPSSFFQAVSDDWFIGKRSGLQKANFTLYELEMIWEYRSQAEITTIRNTGPDVKAPGTDHYYSLDEGSGSTLFDTYQIWNDTQDLTFLLWVALHTGSLMAGVALIGLVMIPGGMVLGAFMVKNNRGAKIELLFRLFLPMMIVLLGFAFFIGGIT